LLGLVLLSIPFAFAALLAAGCGNSAPGIPTGAIATVGSGVVTKADFDQIVNQAKVQAKAQKQKFPAVGTYNYDQYAAQIIDYLVQQKLVDQQAAAWHIKITDKQVADHIARLKTSPPVPPTHAELYKIIRDTLTSQAVFDRVTASAWPAERHLRHILVKTRAEALKVRALLLGGASWKTLAARYSIDAGTKKIGGSLGEVVQGMMVPAFEKAAFGLPLKTISQPVKSAYGWHIIEVLSIGKVNPQVQTYATNPKAERLWANWLRKAKKDAHIRYAEGYDPAVLRKTKPPTATPSPTASPADSLAASGSAAPVVSATP
jgi:parvulin-like peptidyl-prolyl isomerase